MKKYINRTFVVLSIILMNLNMCISNTFAASFDLSGAKSLINGYANPILQLLLWLNPTGCAIACLGIFVKWLFKDEDEKERQKPGRIIKQIIVWGIVAECIVAILAIVGIK